MRKTQNYASFKLNYSLWYKKYVIINHPPNLDRVILDEIINHLN